MTPKALDRSRRKLLEPLEGEQVAHEKIVATVTSDG
jgi:hypothetical protein